ncbi:MAG: methanogenesis marker 6 protein [Methanomassiliicoccales archaeon]|nr:MAG: methanogenesis marker 6 protein [Methanomassiliicoccales archaeon]
MTTDHETRYIVLAPDSEFTPAQLARTIHSMNLDVVIKETCFGVVVSGKKDEIKRTVEEVRRIDPNRIFTKVRGFPVGDQRRCRAHKGSRPGFAQLEKEWKDLVLVEKGLQCIERGEPVPKISKKGKLPVKELQRICREDIQ